MLMAGLDGIENKIDPGSPLDKDIFELDEEELAHVPSVPGSLEEALNDLERITRSCSKAASSPRTSSTLDRLQSKNEADPVRMRPHPYEFHLYYDI